MILVSIVSIAAVAVCFLTAPKPAKTAVAKQAETRSVVPDLPLPKKPVRSNVDRTEPEPEKAVPLFLSPAISADQQCSTIE